jgi:SAM-dependent methyltransferase
MTTSRRPDPALLPHGDGPGAITPDGCSVEFYAALAPGQEPRIVHDAIPERATILELGAGAGRVTHALLALGHPVVAVDESPEMLERIRDAETVLARIEDLDLGRRFDAVLFASYLLNVPDQEWRRTLLAACRRHVSDNGCVLVQRHEPEWFDTAAPFEHHYDDLPQGELVYRMRDVTRPGPGLDAVVHQPARRRRPAHRRPGGGRPGRRRLSHRRPDLDQGTPVSGRLERGSGPAGREPVHTPTVTPPQRVRPAGAGGCRGSWRRSRGRGRAAARSRRRGAWPHG